MKPVSTCILNAWDYKEGLNKCWRLATEVLAEMFPSKTLPAKTSPGIFWREMIPREVSTPELQEAGRNWEMKINSTCCHAFDERTAKLHVNYRKVLFSDCQSCQCARYLATITSVLSFKNTIL